MRCNGGNAELFEDRCTGRSHDAVVRGRGNAHAEDDAADHGQEQADDKGVAREGNDSGDELGGKTGDGDAARDDACHRAGYRDGDGALAAGLESLDELCRGKAAFLIDNADDDCCDDGQGRCFLHGVNVQADENDQQNDGDEQIALDGKLLAGDHLAARNALEAELLGFEVNRDENARKVQECREDSLERDLAVRQVDVLCHQERGCAHDGRHDLTAGGGSSLNCARKFRLIAGLFHHRDGDGAGGNGVADRGAGDHAAQSRGNDRDLCRTAGGCTRDLVCKVDEELCDAGALKESTEYDEHDDELRADVYRGADNAAGGVKQGVDHAAEDMLKIHASAKHAPERVHNKRTHDAQNGNADAPAAQLDERENADNADDYVCRGHLRGAGEHLDDRVKIERVVEEAGRAHDHDDPVKPRDIVLADMVLAHGVVQKAHEVHAAEEDHKTHLKRRGAPQGGVDAVEREQSHDALNDLMGHARPYAGVRLTVIFFHDLVDLGGGYGLVAVIVRGRPGGGLYLLCRRIGVLFLEQGHMKTILSSRYFAEPGSAELSKVSGCFLAQ